MSLNAPPHCITAAELEAASAGISAAASLVHLHDVEQNERMNLIQLQCCCSGSGHSAESAL